MLNQKRQLVVAFIVGALVALTSLFWLQTTSTGSRILRATHVRLLDNLSPEAFVALMKQRIAAHDYSCTGFSRVTEQSCYAWQVATVLNDNVLALKSKPERDYFPYLYALGAMNRVALRISSSRYQLLKTDSNFTMPGDDPEAILKTHAGICGHQTVVFMAIMKQAGFTVRPVQFFFTYKGQRNSHIAAEVLIDGKWRYFDSTWSMIYLTDPKDPFSIASTEEIIRGKAVKRITNQTLPWEFWQEIAGYDIATHLTPASSIVYGYDNGTVDLGTLKGGEVPLTDIPNYIGDTTPDGPFEGLSYRFSPLKGRHVFHITLKDIGGCNDAASRLCAGNSCVAIPADATELSITASNADGLSIRAPQEQVCYIVADKITFEPASKAP